MLNGVYGMPQLIWKTSKEISLQEKLKLKDQLFITKLNTKKEEITMPITVLMFQFKDMTQIVKLSLVFTMDSKILEL